MFQTNDLQTTANARELSTTEIEDVSGGLFFLAVIAAAALAGCVNVNSNNGSGNNNGVKK